MRVTDSLLQIDDSNSRRMALAQRSLEGLALGDAFGETFFGPRAEVAERLAARELRPAPWRWTDDTAQARALVGCLRLKGQLEPEMFCRLLFEEYDREPTRGYGSGIHSFIPASRNRTATRRLRSKPAGSS